MFARERTWTSAQRAIRTARPSTDPCRLILSLPPIDPRLTKHRIFSIHRSSPPSNLNIEKKKSLLSKSINREPQHRPVPFDHVPAAFGYQLSGIKFRISGFGFRVSGFGFRVSGLGFWVWGFGFGFLGFGFQVSNL